MAWFSQEVEKERIISLLECVWLCTCLSATTKALMGRGVCGVCDIASGRCFCCANCLNYNLSDRRLLLQDLQKQRQEVLVQLNALLEGGVSDARCGIRSNGRQSLLCCSLAPMFHTESRTSTLITTGQLIAYGLCTTANEAAAGDRALAKEGILGDRGASFSQGAERAAER